MTEAVQEKAGAKVEMTPKIEGIIKEIKEMSVLELSHLVKVLEEEFGVSAQASFAMPAGAMMAAGGAGAGAAPAEEKTSFNVVLTQAGDKKIQVIKEVRAVTNLGLKEAKDLVDGAPKTVKEGVAKEEAEEIKKKLEAVGATVELK